ncbi:MAG: hypothetical protein EBS07_10380 [Sphingobacteriia bacterium]|nr:hypothetical protein [Sphingobacteriia bacterium]
MIYGINSVAEMIAANRFNNLKVYASNPRQKDQDPAVHITGADSPEDLAESFIREMSYRAPGNQYWLKLYGTKNETAIQETFMIEGGNSQALTGDPPALAEKQAPAFSSNLVEMTADKTRLEIELKAAQEKIEELEGHIIDLEDELEDQEEDNDPLSASLVQILSGLAKPGSGALGDSSEVMVALMEIKAVEPEAEALLIKLGKLAKSNPEQLKGFISTLNKNL